MLAFSRLDPTPRRKLNIWDFLVHQVTVFTKSGIRYLLDDEYHDTRAAGSVNGTLPTPGPGVARVANDVDGDALSVGSGVLSFANPNASWGNPGLWYGGITREAGRVLVIAVNVASGSPLAVGWDSNQATIPAYGFNLAAATALRVQLSAGAAITVGAWATGTEYKLCLVARAAGFYPFIKGGAFTTWTLLYPASGGSDATLYAAIANNNAVFSSVFTRVPAPLWLPTPLAYDSFTRANGVIGSSEAAGPEGQSAPVVAWTGGATWTVASNKMVNTPTLGAELIVNGDFANWTGDDPDNWTVSGEVANDPEVSEAATGESHADTPTLGGGWANIYSTGAALEIYQNVLTAGTWYRGSYKAEITTGGINYNNQGSSRSYRTTTGESIFIFHATGIDVTLRRRTGTDDLNVDDVSTKAITLAELVNIPDLGITNVVAESEIAVDPAGEWAGLAIGWDSQSSPANGIWIFHDGTNVIIQKVVAGAQTTVADTATAFSANALLKCHRDGSSVEVFYNNVKIGSTVTISDAAILAGTRHGAFSTDATPTMDNVLILPRGDGAYDGTLNRYSGARP